MIKGRTMSLEYKKETDKEHVETLESEIVRAVWRSKIACVGSHLAFNVLTHFVGSGSDIEVKVEDKRGKTVETIKGKVYGDSFGGSLIVPEDAREELILTAKLPKHGLEKKSAAVKLIRVWNLKWGQKEARRGDVVKLNAEIEGIADGNEAMIYIYEHDQDGAHDFITKFPGVVKGNKLEAEWEYDYHEDTDDIPTEEEKQRYGRYYNYPEYFFVIHKGGCGAQSDLLRFRDWVEIEFVDEYGEPVKDAEYIVKLADGTEVSGKLDQNGTARIEDVVPGPYWVQFPEYDDDIGP